ncbi:MAG: hypothetical protein SWJ54_10920, partial [Cyanobacteriota bacterium]|nr:hypothetical protein [Cyanobacteriota bacterium]
NSSELVEVRDQADITASTGGTGNAGNININTEGQLRILDGALITVSTDEGSSGNAGSINITASELVEIRGTSADGTISVLLAETESTGDGGNVNIETGQLRLADGAVIAVSADEGSSGNAGSINITASELVEIRAGEFATGLLAQTESTGNAGNIRIETEQFQVRDGGSVDVRSTASGRPGNIEISANETLLDNQAELNARSEAGQGGNIRLQSNDVRLFNESEIVATGSENNQTFEGNIEIDANLLVLLQGSQILTNAFSPSGGSNINIRPLDSELGLLQSQDSTISAAGELSIDNTLNFDPPEALEVTVVDPAELIAQDPCKLRGDSEFIITGRGGIAPDPTQELTSIEGLVEWESFLVEPVTPQVNRSSRRRQQQARKRDNNRDNHPLDSRTIVPARGWIRNSDGEVILVGYDPTKTGVQRQPNPSHSCQS